MQKLAYTQITTEKFAYFPVFEKMERIMYIHNPFHSFYFFGIKAKQVVQVNK